MPLAEFHFVHVAGAVAGEGCAPVVAVVDFPVAVLVSSVGAAERVVPDVRQLFGHGVPAFPWVGQLGSCSLT